MKDLLNPRGGLSGLLWETKFIYTLFLLFNLGGYYVMGVLIWTRTGLTPEATAAYYLGDGKFQYGKSFVEMTDTTHAHLFSIPLMLFVQGHLFMLCSWPRALKAGVVVAAFTGAALQIGAPWLVVYSSRDYVFLVNTGRALLALCFLIFTVVPLLSMWRKKMPSGAS